MKTVLVVDDDADIRELIIWKLAQAGYRTLAEADGEGDWLPPAGPAARRRIWCCWIGRCPG